MAFRNRVFAVPVHQELTQSELQQIADGVLKATAHVKEESQKTNTKIPIPGTKEYGI
jgi:hypothetical protein